MALWQKQGIAKVVFDRGFAALKIDLAAVTAEWFALDESSVDFFVFILASNEAGVEVRLEAMHGEDRTPADEFTGIILIKENEELEITGNGTYDFPQT